MYNNFYLKNFTYLDDTFVGNEDAKQLSEDLKNLIGVLQQGDFPAHKIVSNNSVVLEDIDDALKGPTDIHKVYGQIWNLKSDQLTLNLKKQAPIEEGKLFKKWIEELYQLENFTITRSFLPVTFQEVSVAAFQEVNAGRENMLHS